MLRSTIQRSLTIALLAALTALPAAAAPPAGEAPLSPSTAPSAEAPPLDGDRIRAGLVDSHGLEPARGEAAIGPRSPAAVPAMPAQILGLEYDLGELASNTSICIEGLYCTNHRQCGYPNGECSRVSGCCACYW